MREDPAVPLSQFPGISKVVSPGAFTEPDPALVENATGGLTGSSIRRVVENSPKIPVIFIFAFCGKPGAFSLKLIRPFSLSAKSMEIFLPGVVVYPKISLQLPVHIKRVLMKVEFGESCLNIVKTCHSCLLRLTLVRQVMTLSMGCVLISVTMLFLPD